ESSDRRDADSTLTWNDNGKYTARWVHLKVSDTRNVFLRGIEELDLPIAHAEGRHERSADQALQFLAERRCEYRTPSNAPSERCICRYHSTSASNRRHDDRMI